MGLLTQRTRHKLSTPRWKPLRDLFIRVGEAILEVSPEAQGDLAGTYVKFTTSQHPTSAAYAVVWLEASAPKRLMVGLALPEDFEAAGLGPPPEPVFYQGLTKFLVIEEGQAMMSPTEVNDLLDAVAKVLLRCWIFGLFLLLFWFGMVVLAGDFVYGVHGNMFDLSRHEMQVIHYCGMGLVKLVVGLFFFIPWVSIRLVLRKAKG